MKEFSKEFSKTGKSVLIISGIHGNQHTSVYAADILQNSISNNQFIPTGISKIKFINFVNEYGILENQREDEFQIDLNREFSNEKSSNKNIEYLKKQISKFDIIFDLHSSFNSTEFVYLNTDQYLNSYLTYLNKESIPYVIDKTSNNTVKNYSNKLGKVGFTIEMNQYGRNIDELSAFKVNKLLKYILNTVSTFNKYSDIDSLQQTVSIVLTADITGLLKIKKVPGDIVTYGQNIGYIKSLDNKQLIFITAPCSGRIITVSVNFAYIKVNTPIAQIQPK